MMRHRLISCLFLTVALSTSAFAASRLDQARMAAVDGDHARCALIADEIRKSDNTSWYVNQVFASCRSLDARKNKDKLGPEKFETMSMEAIEAIEEIVSNTDGLTARQRIKFSHMAVEMRKQLAIDLKEMASK